MLPDWLWIFMAVGGVLVLVGLLAAARQILYSTPVISFYPGGIELVGVKLGRYTIYRSIQWLADPAAPRPCPLVVHLPRGDLAGDSLCDWNATNAALELGGPGELEIWPFRDEGGRVVGVSIRMVPWMPLGKGSVEVSINGMRIVLPLTHKDASRLLGEPTVRVAHE